MPPAPSQRQRSPEAIHPFESAIVVPHVRDIPLGCRCTWVPRPDGFNLPVPAGADPFDTRQPWLTAGMARKFADAECPVRHQTG